MISLAQHFTLSPTFKCGVVHLAGDQKSILMTLFSHLVSSVVCNHLSCLTPLKAFTNTKCLLSLVVVTVHLVKVHLHHVDPAAG